MLYSIKDREDLKILEELVSLENQVKVVKLQDKLGKQNFHESLKNVFETVTKSLENTSENLTKAINNNLLEIMNDRGILATYLMSPLSRITNPDNASQFRLVKDSSSNRVNDLKINKTIPIT